MADLGDIGDFLTGIGSTVVTTFKGINAPSSVSVKPTAARPDGSTSGQTKPQGMSTTMLLLVVAVGVLGLAFVLTVARK